MPGGGVALPVASAVPEANESATTPAPERAHPARAAFAVAGLVAVVAAVALAPATAGAFDSHVLGPLRAQATGVGAAGYSTGGLAFWAASGAVLAYAALVGVIRPLSVRWDAAFAVSLAPYLVFGPVFHALLSAGAWARGGVVAYAAAEPLVYVTTGALAAVGLLAGAGAARAGGGERARVAVPAGLGLLLLALMTPAAVAAAAGGHGVGALGFVAAAAAVGALAWLVGRALAPRVAEFGGLAHWAGAAVVAAHALDGFTTWVVLRDPFGWGFGGFGEKNPVSAMLVESGSGILFPVAKLVLAVGLVVMTWRSTAEPEERALRGPILLALFALGWGPGAANLGLIAFAA